MTGFVRFAFLVASLMVSVNSLTIQEGPQSQIVSGHGIIRQQRASFNDISNSKYSKPAVDDVLDKTVEQNQFHHDMSTRTHTASADIKNVERQRPPRSSDSRDLHFTVKDEEEVKRFIRSTENYKSGKETLRPQTYISKRLYLGFVPGRKMLRPEIQSRHHPDTLQNALDLTELEGVGRPSGNSESSTFGETAKSAHGAGNDGLSQSVSTRREIESACFPFCLPHYSGKRGYDSRAERLTQNHRGIPELVGEPHIDSSNWYPSVFRREKTKQIDRRCFPFCLPHYSGKRTLGHIQRMTETKQKEESKQNYGGNSRMPIFRIGKRRSVLPSKHILRQYVQDSAPPLHAFLNAAEKTE